MGLVIIYLSTKKQTPTFFIFRISSTFTFFSWFTRNFYLTLFFRARKTFFYTSLEALVFRFFFIKNRDFPTRIGIYFCHRWVIFLDIVRIFSLL